MTGLLWHAETVLSFYAPMAMDGGVLCMGLSLAEGWGYHSRRSLYCCRVVCPDNNTLPSRTLHFGQNTVSFDACVLLGRLRRVEVSLGVLRGLQRGGGLGAW